MIDVPQRGEDVSSAGRTDKNLIFHSHLSSSSAGVLRTLSRLCRFLMWIVPYIRHLLCHIDCVLTTLLPLHCFPMWRVPYTRHLLCHIESVLRTLSPLHHVDSALQRHLLCHTDFVAHGDHVPLLISNWHFPLVQWTVARLHTRVKTQYFES